MQCDRGDIVIVPFPFTDLSSIKTRPALVISDNIPGDNVVLSLITSNTRKSPFSVTIRKTDKKVFKQSGLKISSSVKVDSMGSFDKRILIGKLGSLDKKLQKQVEINLKKVLGL